MGTGEWFSYVGDGGGEPPGDAYSSFTNQERFRPLHDRALETVARLQAEYEVTLEEGVGLDAELERLPLSRATLRLTPLQGSSATITIVFTDSPALEVRVGRWVTDGFPSCHCDACDEMPEEEFERFTELVSDVVAGRFRESLRLRPGGAGWTSREFWFADGYLRRSGGSRMSPVQASLILKGEKEIALEWTPWQPKTG